VSGLPVNQDLLAFLTEFKGREGWGSLSKMAVTRQLDLIAWSREESRLTFLRVADDSDGGQRKGVCRSNLPKSGFLPASAKRYQLRVEVIAASNIGHSLPRR
jgi:hypothetical protein